MRQLGLGLSMDAVNAKCGQCDEPLEVRFDLSVVPQEKVEALTIYGARAFRGCGDYGRPYPRPWS